MTWRDIVLRLRALFLRRQVEQDLEDELQFHLEMQKRKHGGSAEAQRQARIQFGSVNRSAEECRDARGVTMIEMIIKDIRYAVYMLRKSPSFTAVAVLTLALTIGVNSVVFGILNAFILRPLNVPRVESLYGIDRNGWGFLSYPNYLDIRDRSRSFESLAAVSPVYAAVDVAGTPTPTWGYAVSGNYFDALGIQPYLGRLLHASDEQGPNSAPYIVLTYAYWQNQFAGDRNVVGRVVQMNKHPFTVIGITPPEFRGTLLYFSAPFFVPIVDIDQFATGSVTGENVLQDRKNFWGVMEALGHLKPGVSPAAAAAELNSIGVWLAQTYPQDNGPSKFSLKRPALHPFGGEIAGFLSGVMLLAALILLAACANLGSLFAARAADRSRDIALRLALGASRGRILQQLFTEAIVISIIGGAIGLLGSTMLLSALGGWQPFSQFPVIVPVSPDGRVYIAALALAIVSGFLFGAAPVRQVLHTDPYQIVKSGSATTFGRGLVRRMTLRDVLLVAQVAICAVMVTSSLVAVRGLMRSLHSSFGFQPQNTLTIGTDLNMAGYRGDKADETQKRLLDEIQSLPGVTAAALSDTLPLSLAVNRADVFTEQQTDLKAATAAASTFVFRVSPGYFRAAGTALIGGRSLTSHDGKDAPRVAIVNREFARVVFKEHETITGALSRRFKLADGTPIEVVGIVEDGKYFNIAEAARPAMFLPILQSPSLPAGWFLLRSERDPQDLTAALEDVRRRVDPAIPFDIQSWSKVLETNLFPSRVAAAALGVLGVMAAMLSITGVFGLAAYSVSRRMKELGIRIALGATRKEVLEAALGRAFKLLAIGSVAGLILGIVASRVLAFIVYQATPRDPFVLAGAVIAMFALGLIATWIPARRALLIDPLVMLRDE
jgi:predicted permease